MGFKNPDSAYSFDPALSMTMLSSVPDSAYSLDPALSVTMLSSVPDSAYSFDPALSVTMLSSGRSGPIALTLCHPLQCSA